MAINPAHIGSWRDPDIARIGAGHGTRPVIVSKAGAYGSRFHVLSASQASGLSANAIRLLIGKRMTSVTGTGFNYGTGSITRTTGDFLSEGWKVGDRLVATGSTTVSNDAETIVTAVASLSLTVTAATFAVTEAVPVGTAFYKTHQPLLVPIAASAGQAAGTASLDLLDPAIWKSIDPAPDRSGILGPNGGIFAAVTTAIATGASNWIDLLAMGGDY